MESTGHYWFTFAQHLKDHNTKIVLVNPFHVKRSKELDDNNPTKNDRKTQKPCHASKKTADTWSRIYPKEYIVTHEMSWKPAGE